MRLLLHIGMPKAGSTALQNALYSYRSFLNKNGICYPPTPYIRSTHTILVSFLTGQKPKHEFHSNINIDEVVENWLRSIHEHIEKYKSHTLIISSEVLFYATNEKTEKKLWSILDQFEAEKEVICYVRKPSEFYLSSAQQIIKRSNMIRAVSEIKYREVISIYEKYLKRKISVINYNDIMKQKGDILKDFCERFLPNINAEELKRSSIRQNETISAEGMCIMHAYRDLFHKDSNSFVKDDAERAFKNIARAEKELGIKRPEIFDEIREEIDHGSPDLLWLRDYYGITFEGIDYGKIGKPLPPQQKHRIEDICKVDQVRKERLMMEVIKLFAQDDNNIIPDSGKQAKEVNKEIIKKETKKPDFFFLFFSKSFVKKIAKKIRTLKLIAYR